MPDADLARRVEMLEETQRSLRELPDDVRDLKRRVTGVEVQVLQLRTEMRGEFSAIRSEMATKSDLADGLAAVRSEMATKTDLAELRSETKADLAEGLARVRWEITATKDELREDIAGMGRDLAQMVVDNQRELTDGLRKLSDGQNQLRMMVEDVRSLIQIRSEGNPPSQT